MTDNRYRDVLAYKSEPVTRVEEIIQKNGAHLPALEKFGMQTTVGTKSDGETNFSAYLNSAVHRSKWNNQLDGDSIFSGIYLAQIADFMATLAEGSLISEDVTFLEQFGISYDDPTQIVFTGSNKMFLLKGRSPGSAEVHIKTLVDSFLSHDSQLRGNGHVQKYEALLNNNHGFSSYQELQSLYKEFLYSLALDQLEWVMRHWDEAGIKVRRDTEGGDFEFVPLECPLSEEDIKKSRGFIKNLGGGREKVETIL